jgi:hypothetical protein
VILFLLNDIIIQRRDSFFLNDDPISISSEKESGPKASVFISVKSVERRDTWFKKAIGVQLI